MEIGSHINRWNWDLQQPEPGEVWDLDAPELQCVFAAAEELGAAVFIHPWDMDQSPRMKKYWMPWLVGEYRGGVCTSVLMKRSTASAKS